MDRPKSILKTFTLVLVLATCLGPKHANGQLPTRPNYFWTGCYNRSAGFYSLNSIYHNNLRKMLSDLVSHASNAPFYNSSTGLSDGPEAAYGQYYCRGDISSQLCYDCIEAAADKVFSEVNCFEIKEGTIWYKECTLLYGNRSRVGIMEEYPGVSSKPSLHNVSDPAKFKQVFINIMSTLVQEAAYGNSSKGFATGDAFLSDFETVYCLVQCSPDILGSPCENCLRSVLRAMGQWYGYQFDYVFFFYPSCQVRYSLTPFYYNISVAAPPAISPPPPPAPFSSRPAPPSPDPKYYVIRVVVPVVAGVSLLLAVVALLCLYRRKTLLKNSSPQTTVPKDVSPEEADIGNMECFSLRAVEDATMKFSLVNKLGEGGFGIVYKGTLPNGLLVAIKRLSRISSQGMREFKTELAVVAKLQHKNLVRLVGYCIEQEERILVYEFLRNLSLDKILFDSSKSVNLDWQTRYGIIEGIVWGLRYLHIDSLLTIIHRDLKSSNILLDEKMSPKISDFGIARLVNVDETTVNTNRISGTYGYMAPEYAMSGRFSVKTDIYSFGVILLEILSGQSVGRFYNPVTGDGLLRHAWILWNEGAVEQLMDPVLENKYSRIQAERCVQVGLLCVQDDTTRRPTIRAILGMLENQSLELPYPLISPVFLHGAHSTTQNTDPGSGQSPSSGIDLERQPYDSLHSDLFPR